MSRIWSDPERFKRWFRVETETMRVREQRGEIPAHVPDDLEEKITIDPAAIEEIEKKTKHDVLAFIQHVSTQIPEELRRWFHHKMTSYDAQDTGLSLALNESLDLIGNGVRGLMDVLKKRSLEFKSAPMIGRTHGIHAEPITFGLKLANYYETMWRQLQRITDLRKRLRVIKLSGAVGTYTQDPEVEEEVGNRLNLKPVVSTQIIPRDIITEYVGVLSNIAGSLGNFATNIRLLQQTEIMEVMEYFSPGQKGSSAMPHKKNPVGSENVTSLSRYLPACFGVAIDNQNTWHERDLANSANERIILADSSLTLDYMLVRFTEIIEKLLVFPDQMLKNLNLTKGLIYSQEVMSLVAAKSGLPREEAWEIVQEIAFRCWQSRFELDFKGELLKDPRITERITIEELDSCFSLENKLRHVDAIFKRIFGS